MLAVLLLAPLLASADATIATLATPASRAALRASAAAQELVVGPTVAPVDDEVVPGVHHGGRR